jgi:hypothetical protein
MPPNSRRRLFEVRTSQGHPLTQPIIWHSDGGDTRRDLQLDLNSHAEHLLDRFHGTLRLAVPAVQWLNLPSLLSRRLPYDPQSMSFLFENIKEFSYRTYVCLQTPCVAVLSRRLPRLSGAVVSSDTRFYGEEYFPDTRALLHRRERWHEGHR